METMMKKNTILILLAVLTVHLLSCEKPLEPVLDNKYDRQSENFVASADLATTAVSEIRALEAVSGGRFENDYGTPVTAKGVCWSTEQNPVVGGSCTNDGTGFGEFTSRISDLQPDTRYYVRAYATNADGTIYGEQREFTTRDGIPIFSGIPSIELTSIGVMVSVIFDDGGRAITSLGVCYSTLPNPTTSGTCVTTGSSNGSFTLNLSSLSLGTAYYARAYATNSLGTTYGLQTTFTYILSPTVTTDSVDSITASRATVGGIVTSDGGSTVTSRGICYATTQNPTTANTCRTSGSGTGAFTVNLTALSYVTTYYVRAYATNSVGTTYGLQSTFTTLAKLPNVTTNHVSGYYGQNWIYFTGDVTSDGGSTVTERGICFYTNIDPNKCIVLGSGTGSFGYQLFLSTSITWVTFRAYATNSIGTSYGLERWYVFN
jgi:hypothetical protein